MRLPELSIRRPVLATVMNLLLVLIGLVAYDRLSVREYPNIDVPVVTVEVVYPGASAAIMETQVASVLEDGLSGIEGVDYIRSVNRAEKSQISIRFKLDRDADGAAADVRDRVGRVRGELPDGIDQPIVAKVEADADAIIWLTFSSDRHTPLEVTDFADRRVKDRLETVTGVASVILAGERRYAMRIWLDAQRLAAHGLTVQDVEQALRNQNLEVPAGRVESSSREFTVLTETDLNAPEAFGAIILSDTDGYLVRLRDVARVELGARDERTIARFNGQPSVAIGIVKQSTANPLEMSQGIREEVDALGEILPEGMSVYVAYDGAVFIERSVKEVYKTIAEAVALVVLVIFLFLRSVRATLIPLVTIPVSLIGAFSIMLALGYSINTLTLLAMVLAIGLVVDDAIVVLENIHRHIENGLRPMQAAIKGSREIAMAVVAMTLTLAAVFAPLAFSTGRTGKLFTEFALTLAGAVLISGFIALTLSPMMSSRLLTSHRGGWFYRLGEFLLNGLTKGYRGLLWVVLKIRWLVIPALIGIGWLGWTLYPQLPSELSPTEDRSFFIAMGIGPDGATPEFTLRYLKTIESMVAPTPEVKSYFGIVGYPSVTDALLFADMQFWEERSRSAQQVVGELAPQLFGGVTGLMSFAATPPPLGQDPTSKDVEIVIQTSGGYGELAGVVGAVTGQAWGYGGLDAVDTDFKPNKPELKVTLDREKTAAVGLNPAMIGRTLETLLGGREVTRFKRGAEQYDVVVQIEDSERRDPRDLSDILVRGGNGGLVQLDNLVQVRESVAPRELNHFDKLRSATISANLKEGQSLGEALSFFEKAIADVAPPDTRIDYLGNSREFKESGREIYLVFVLALAFIYLVLAAQFESFRDPLIILLSVPTALVGALGTLYLTGNSLNIYSQIGMVTLVGLITKHGILIVEFANQLRDQGIERYEAVLQSAAQRLRPILMTTAAMVLGAVPLALATGAGAEGRRAIGWVVVGGMGFGTLMTLFVVPAMYLLLSARERRRIPAAEPDPVPVA